MILRALKVSSFAGLANATLELSPGLNVVLGPNEAGKSTLFQALVHTLLTPARLAKPVFQRTVGRFLPAGGGDSIGAELDFEVRGAGYRLAKRWGATPEAELELPDGSRLTREEAIQESLGQLLPADPGTLRAVFLTRQAGLEATLAELGEHPEALHSLSDLLRRSLLESDKISIGGFQDLLNQRIHQVLDHWDAERRRPEAGRGWDNPWKKSVGSVLQAFYDLQSLEARERDTLAAERSYEARLQEFGSCRERLEELRIRLEAEAPIVQDAEGRALLESQREASAVRLEALKKTYDEWTEHLLIRERGEAERGGLLERSTRLQAEQAEVEGYARDRELREAFARAREQKAQWEAAQTALQEAVELPAARMKTLRSAAAELERLAGAISGGALSLRLEARQPLDLEVTRDLQDPESERLDPGASRDLEAEGRIRIEHSGWSLEVTSGRVSFRELAAAHREAQSRLQSLLQTAGVPSPEAAEQAHSLYGRLEAEADAASRAFDQALCGESWEQLEAASRALAPTRPARELAVVMAELGEVRAGLGRVEESLRRAGERVAALERVHQNRERLLASIGEHTGRLQELERQLSGLRELPDGAGDAEAFLNRHRGAEREAQQLREQTAGLESSLQEAVRHLPEESAEELGSQLSEARRSFEREQLRAEALLRVREAADGVLGSLDDATTDGFRSRFEEYVRLLSAARYRGTNTGTLLPEALQREDGRLLRYELLSAGTRDLFSLALRLAMAELFLAGDGHQPGEGFLIMDDPLVDLDPERQELAAAVLARFAETQQLVVFTCHPSHAELLAAGLPEGRREIHRIELARI